MLPKSLLGLRGESPEPNPPSPPYPPVDEEAKPYSRRRAKGNALWSQHIRSSEQGRTQSTRQTSCDPIPRNPPLPKLPQRSPTMDRLVYQSISEERQRSSSRRNRGRFCTQGPPSSRPSSLPTQHPQVTPPTPEHSNRQVNIHIFWRRWRKLDTNDTDHMDISRSSPGRKPRGRTQRPHE